MKRFTYYAKINFYDEGFKKDRINECRFSSRLELKQHWEVKRKDLMILNWIAQQDFDEYEFKEFIKEVKRYFNYVKMENIKRVKIKAYSRNHSDVLLGYEEFNIEEV